MKLYAIFYFIIVLYYSMSLNLFIEKVSVSPSLIVQSYTGSVYNISVYMADSSAGSDYEVINVNGLPVSALGSDLSDYIFYVNFVYGNNKIYISIPNLSFGLNNISVPLYPLIEMGEDDIEVSVNVTAYNIKSFKTITGTYVNMSTPIASNISVDGVSLYIESITAIPDIIVDLESSIKYSMIIYLINSSMTDLSNCNFYVNLELTDLPPRRTIMIPKLVPGINNVSFEIIHYLDEPLPPMDSLPLSVSASIFAVAQNTCDNKVYESNNVVVQTPFSPNVICVSGDSLVKTNEGLIKIADMKSSNDLKLFNNENEQVNLLYVIKCMPSNDYIKIDKNAIGEDMPSEDLLIRPGHPIMVDNKEVMPETLINGLNIMKQKLEKPENTYSICSDKRQFVMINNLPVCTWEEKEWEEQSKEQNIIWSKQ